MRNTCLVITILIALIALTASISATQQQPAGVRWVARTGVAFAPWTFDLKIDGGTVTGSATQGNADPNSGFATTLSGPFPVIDGKADGNTISFKLGTADGGRIVTFNGTRNGNQIAFTRSVQVVRGDPGRDGILGATGATQFVATLDDGRASPPANAPPAATTSGPNGRWQVMQVPNAPWVFEFTAVNDSLTGTIRQSGAPNNPVSIAGGKIDGTTIAFKVLTPDAQRLITFRGRVNGNEISFVRQIEVLVNGTRGGNDLFGASAALQFVASRAR